MKEFVFTTRGRTDREEDPRPDRPTGLHLIVSPIDDDRSSPRDGDAVFRKHHEASSIELFFDLFFVANLTVFTKQHEIKSRRELASYIGFFSLLWCTWLQIAIYDVRFAVDSVFGRVCKACHIGIMMGFAVAIPRWDTTDTSGRAIRSFRIIDLILMSSRYLLAIQYFMVAWFARKYRNTRNPLLGLSCVFLVSACIFLGTLFAFPQGAVRIEPEIALYIVSGLEVVVTIGISIFWRTLSFKHTHIVERVGLLTLIIIGEGIIGMALAISKVLDSTLYIAEFAGILISGDLIIYFLYMLYFDQVQTEKIGTIRMQIWVLLHFPLHVAYLLTAEAIGQFIVWCILNDQTDQLTTVLNNALKPPPTTLPQLITDLNSSLTAWAGGVTDTSSNPLDLSTVLEELKHAGDINSTETSTALGELVDECLEFLFGVLQVEPPKAQRKALSSANAEQRAEVIFGVFITIFYYLFIAAGVALIVLGVLRWISTKNNTKADYMSIALKAVIGTGLALLTTIAVPRANGDYSGPFGRYFSSPWILPTVTLAFGLVVVLDNIITYVYYRQRR